MKNLKFYNFYILSVLLCFAFTACEIDNYNAPDCTIEGKMLDHLGQPFQVNQGAEIIRSREISWAKNDTSIFTENRKLKVQQDGTYRHTKMFKGTYRLLPLGGAFFPYDDINKEGDDAGELVEINGTATQDFKVTPFLTVEWVQKPTVDADGYLNCSAKFIRNQKAGYEMPDLRRANLKVSRVLNVGEADGELFTTPLNLANTQEGIEIKFKTSIPLKFKGIKYWVRISIECQAVSGKPATNYQGVSAGNFSTIEEIFVP
jgi:hypothetical protein